MSSPERKNQSGGSAMGGGAEYQAEAFALVAAKILAADPLLWVNTACDRVPVFVRMETGSGGDDLRITLRSGKRIELQAKRQFRDWPERWAVLLALAQSISSDADIYAVILVTHEEPNTFKVEMRAGIERIANHYEKISELNDHTKQFVDQLLQNDLDPCVVCKRLFIQVVDFDGGSDGEAQTYNTMRQAIALSEQAGAAISVFVKEGLKLIRMRGGCYAPDLAMLLQQSGIGLSHNAKNLLVVQAAFLQWYIECNSSFVIPGLQLALPMNRAWVRLKTMSANSGDSGGGTLEEQLHSYHEWHRLAETNARFDSVSVEMAVRVHSKIIVVAGPGSGKSTLLRRLAYSWGGRRQANAARFTAARFPSNEPGSIF